MGSGAAADHRRFDSLRQRGTTPSTHRRRRGFPVGPQEREARARQEARPGGLGALPKVVAAVRGAPVGERSDERARPCPSGAERPAEDGPQRGRGRAQGPEWEREAQKSRRARAQQAGVDASSAVGAAGRRRCMRRRRAEGRSPRWTQRGHGGSGPGSSASGCGYARAR